MIESLFGAGGMSPALLAGHISVAFSQKETGVSICRIKPEFLP